ncbi:MAG: LamG domain-containing protein [Candidatus Kariarchaeaceae archaeon]|jgi:hypothetical protein
MKSHRTWLVIISFVAILSFNPTNSAKIEPLPHELSTDESLDLANGLVTQWGFDEETGSSIVDAASQRNLGSLHGPVRSAGPIDQALEFDGVDDYVQILDNGSVPSKLSSVGDGSISIWFRLDQIPEKGEIAPLFYYGGFNPCTNMPDASNQGFIIEVGHGRIGSNRIYFTTFANGCEYPSFCVDSRHLLLVNQWYFFSVVIEENYNTIYLNGEELEDRHYNFGSVTSSEFFADAVAGETIWLGKGYWNSELQFLDGGLDEIRVYDRALSGDEILALYKLGDPNYRTYETMFDPSIISNIMTTSTASNRMNYRLLPWMSSMILLTTGLYFLKKKTQ